MALRHLVVVVPGIGGSVLTRPDETLDVDCLAVRERLVGVEWAVPTGDPAAIPF